MELKVAEEHKNTRLDKYIRKKFEGVNLDDIFKIISNGKIRVNREKKRQNYRLQEGDIVFISDNIKDIKLKTGLKLSEEEISDIKKSIKYEDEKIAIIYKEPGMVMHKGSGHEFGLSEMMKSYYNSEVFTFINRIDKETSGLIIGAKSMEVVRELGGFLEQGKIRKLYYIFVEGKIKEKEFVIETFLRKEKDKIKEYSSYIEGSKKSISKFKVIDTFENRTLLEGELFTGRTHQLRVQLSEMGHPIIGDAKYGNAEKNSYMRLLSHRVLIEDYGIDVNVDYLPDFISL